MADQGNDVKDETNEVGEQVPVVDVQRRLAELMSRAGFGGERIILTRNGKPTAAMISMKDLERLRALDDAA